MVNKPQAEELRDQWLLEAVTVINASSTPHDYCRRLTTHPVLGEGMVGNHLFLLDSAGAFRLMGGYGINPLDQDAVFSQFDESLFARALESGRYERESFNAEYDIQVCPAFKAGVPNGAIMSVLKPGVGAGETFEMRTFQEFAYYLALGTFVAGAGFSAQEIAKRAPTNEALSERQLVILQGIAEGKTNLQISKELILSESAIKQETVKIFRSLGVANRRQAAQKANAMGMLSQLSNPELAS